MKHNYLEDIVCVCGEVMRYARTSALYEVQVKVSEAQAQLRRKTYLADAAEMHVLTKNLAVAKMKITLMKAQIESFSPECQATLSCLFDEAEKYIASLRQGRAEIVRRRRT